mmetsp:Transcript_6265/g.13737  ORF Transcript_6265/g.13737 Transcript_6265/m.13737 type:complete len:611 (+) Transcript_6265:42-1874(+)
MESSEQAASDNIEIAVAKVKEILDKYNAKFNEIRDAGQAKPDMQAVKILKSIIPKRRHGHIPGVKPGDKFVGRGQLAILALHTQILRGIDFLKDETRGAYAVVLSGGYADDEDEGSEFWYTGEGGQKGKKQINDQTWTGGNLALKQSCETKTPVRVFRGVNMEGVNMYLYEGLYNVTEYKLAVSKDGPLVCKFKMEGVPGESVATLKVTFNSLKPPPKSRLTSVKLAAAPGAKGRKKRRLNDGADSAQQRELLLAAVRGLPGLLHEDISGGLEQHVPIPLFNEVDGEGLPEDFTYIADYSYAEGVEEQVREILECEDAKMLSHVNYAENGNCGIKFNRMMRAKDQAWLLRTQQPEGEDLVTYEESYTEEGLLKSTDPCGLHECGSSCTSARCKRNKQVTQGIVLPLEVFKTQHKGWGVRCRQLIPAGAFVCCYVGELVTDAMAEQMRGQDHYLFSLDFFMHIFKEVIERGMVGIEEEMPAHKIPPFPLRPFPSHLVGQLSSPQKQQEGEGGEGADPLEPDFSPLMVVDAARRGNVGRFINHSCDGNLTIQAVFAKKARNVLLYYVALFASRDILQMEELTYDYGYHSQASAVQRGMTCHCGAPTCKGMLL